MTRTPVEVPFAARRVTVRRGWWVFSCRVVTDGTFGMFRGRKMPLCERWPTADAIEVDMTN